MLALPEEAKGNRCRRGVSVSRRSHGNTDVEGVLALAEEAIEDVLILAAEAVVGHCTASHKSSAASYCECSV